MQNPVSSKGQEVLKETLLMLKKWVKTALGITRGVSWSQPDISCASFLIRGFFLYVE